MQEAEMGKGRGTRSGRGGILVQDETAISSDRPKRRFGTDGLLQARSSSRACATEVHGRKSGRELPGSSFARPVKRNPGCVKSSPEIKTRRSRAPFENLGATQTCPN